MDLASQLVDSLPVNLPGLFNPWKERCEFDICDDAPQFRRERLRAHLNCDAKFILVGEAPGYQGCRYSGVAFTSESLILNGTIPRIERPYARLTKRERPFCEPQLPSYGARFMRSKSSIKRFCGTRFSCTRIVFRNRFPIVRQQRRN